MLLLRGSLNLKGVAGNVSQNDGRIKRHATIVAVAVLLPLNLQEMLSRKLGIGEERANKSFVKSKILVEGGMVGASRTGQD